MKRLDHLLPTQSKPARPVHLLFQRMVMTKLGMPCTIHHACDCLDLLGVLCELGTCLQLLGEPARIGASEPLGE
ncbi:hypothetical protein FHW77_005352, partial [Agrobacterium sp. RC10-4-1]|nr:hypothetical protein [Agrobacterium sp. RC10-4-1]